MGSVVDVTQTQADWVTGTLTGVETVSDGSLQLKKQFNAPVNLYLPEVSASGTNPAPARSFSAINVTGLTKKNGKLQIDLKCSNWSARSSGDAQLEITSSGTCDNQEWHYIYISLSIASNYKTFEIPLSLFADSGGGLNPANINYIRCYAYFSSSQTLAWRNARLLGGYSTDGGYRVSPQVDLQPVGQVVSSSIKWQRGNEYFDVVGGWHPDTVALGAIDGFGDVHKITKTSNYDDIFTNQFTTSDFPNYAGPGKYAYMEFWAKWDELPTFEGVITKLVCPPPDPNKYQKYVLKSDGQYSVNEYFCIYYNTNQNDGATAYIADPIVYLDTVDIETRHSLDGGSTWTSWTECANGEPVPNLPYGTVTTAGLLECRQTLTTQDPSITPKLSNLIISVEGMENTFFMFPF